MDHFTIKLPSLPILSDSHATQSTPGPTSDSTAYKILNEFLSTNSPFSKNVLLTPKTIPKRGRLKWKHNPEHLSPSKWLHTETTPVTVKRSSQTFATPSSSQSSHVSLPLSPSKHQNSTHDDLENMTTYPSIPAPFPSHNFHQGKPSMWPHPSQFQCSTCNCNSETIGPSKDKQKISTLECVEIVLMVLQAQSLTISKFLMTLLDEPEGLSQSANEMLKWFIQSHTKGRQPSWCGPSHVQPPMGTAIQIVWAFTPSTST